MENLAQDTRSSDSLTGQTAARVDMKLEVVVSFADVDRVKEFYSRIAWRLDADRTVGDNFRLIQFTPPGSGSSVQSGVNLTSATPGSAQGILLAVSCRPSQPPGGEAAGSVRRDITHRHVLPEHPTGMVGATQIGPNTQPRPNSDTVSTNPE
jgi:hypothetical protein